MSNELQAKFAKLAFASGLQVDAEKGIIKDVALISIGEAAGHGLRVDMETLKGFYALVSGKTVKAFINHEEDPKATEAIGLYSGFYIDAEAGILRAAQFQAFKAFRENNKAEYDTLFEMAADAPDAFGISANFFYNVEEAKDGGYPYTRPTHVESFDIVCTPAANKALFSREQKIIESQSQQTLDTKKEDNKQEKPNETQSQLSAAKPNSISTMKAVFSHFAANSKALPLIAKFAAEMPEDAKPEEVIAKVEMALSEEEQAALIAERDLYKAKCAELEAKLAEISPKVEEAAELGKKVTQLEATVAQFSKARGRFGAAPVNLGKENKEIPAITRAAFDAMNHAERNAHMSAGGKVTD